MPGIFTDPRIADLTKRCDELSESNCDLQRALSEAQVKAEKMTIARTPEGMMKMAETAAHQIEDLYAVGGMNRDQRFKNIAVAVRRQIAIACGGEALWTD